MNSKIFELEQQILQCWNMTDDIDLITKHFIDSPEWGDGDFSPKACDALMNKYFGLKEVYELKFDQMFRTFKEVCEEYHKYRKIVEEPS